MYRDMKLFVILLLSLGAAAAQSQATMETVPALAVASVASPPPAASRVLPASGLSGSVAGDEIYNLLKAKPLFAKLDKELVGSPIVLKIGNSFEPSAGGMAAGLASAVLAGSTLGLLPVVISGDQVVTYELQVNGVSVITRTYRKGFTRSQNLLAKDVSYGMGKDGLAWARGTVDQFATDVDVDPALKTLLDEYEFYFPSKPRTPN